MPVPEHSDTRAFDRDKSAWLGLHLTSNFFYSAPVKSERSTIFRILYPRINHGYKIDMRKNFILKAFITKI